MNRLPHIAIFFAAVFLVGADKKPEKAKKTAPSPEQIQTWIKQLGDKDFKVREEATEHLIKAGRVALDTVTKATKSEDAEVKQRALRIHNYKQEAKKKELEKEIKGLIKKINDPTDIGGYTPAIDRLVEIGIPALGPCLDLMADNVWGTRVRAECVIVDITVKLHGFVPGKGWPEHFKHSQKYKKFRAFWLSLGNLRYDDPPKKRAQAIVKWRRWLKEEGYKKIGNTLEEKEKN